MRSLQQKKNAPLIWLRFAGVLSRGQLFNCGCADFRFRFIVIVVAIVVTFVVGIVAVEAYALRRQQQRQLHEASSFAAFQKNEKKKKTISKKLLHSFTWGKSQLPVSRLRCGYDITDDAAAAAADVDCSGDCDCGKLNANCRAWLLLEFSTFATASNWCEKWFSADPKNYVTIWIVQSEFESIC